MSKHAFDSHEFLELGRSHSAQKVDNAKDGRGSTTDLATDQKFRLLLWRSLSNLDKTDKATNGKKTLFDKN